MFIYGGKDQEDCNFIIFDFKKGVCFIFIVILVVVCGLDVKQLKLVINYDVFNYLEDYVYCVG